MRQRLVRVLLSVAMLIGGAFPASVLAQGLTGQISGTVTDAGGGVMPGATVSIKNAGTNQVRETVTGADGAFTFPDLLAGNYDITVSVQGFKTYEQKGISLASTLYPCFLISSRNTGPPKNSSAQAPDHFKSRGRLSVNLSNARHVTRETLGRLTSENCRSTISA